MINDSSWNSAQVFYKDMGALFNDLSDADKSTISSGPRPIQAENKSNRPDEGNPEYTARLKKAEAAHKSNLALYERCMLEVNHMLPQNGTESALKAW
jgi:hypothetical protein